MHHPSEKWFMIEIVSLLAAFVFGLLAILFKLILFLIIGGYLLSASLICDGLLHLDRRNQQDAGKQLIRAGILFFLLTLFLFL